LGYLIKMAKKRKLNEHIIDEIDNILEGENLSDRIISQDRYGLDFEKQRYVEKNTGSRDILELTRQVFRNYSLDQHSQEFQCVKGFFGKTTRGTKTHDFSREEIEFIKNNADNLRPTEIVRTLFPEEKGLLANEVQTVGKLIKAFGIEYQGSDIEPDLFTQERYRPPETDHKILALINRCDMNAGFSIQKLDSKKKECISCLKRNLHSERFVTTMNQIRRRDHRAIYEREFVAATYDKPDLNSEDRNGYIDLCYDYVIAAQTQEQIAILNDRLAEASNEDESNGKKFTMVLSEALSTKADEYDKARKRIAANSKSLSSQRSTRLLDMATSSMSLSKLVEVAQEEEERKKMLLIARAYEVEVGKEVEKVANFDSLFAEVFGVNKQEIFS
jgi:hypothetical protein